MPTIAQIVSEIVKKRPFLEEALVSDIINYAYLADQLKPQIEKETRKEVNRYAIIMAIRRLQEQLKESFVGMAATNFRNAEITINSGIFEVTIEKDIRAAASLGELYQLLDLSKGDFITITYGLFEITIISNSKYKERILGLLGRNKIVKVADRLSSLVVRLPLEAADSVGVLYELTKALSWENISIVEVVSTLTEEIFIINEDDTATAFSAINRLIGK